MSQKTSSLLMELTVAVSELEAEHGAALSGYTQARSELFGVIAQRDELLEALKELDAKPEYTSSWIKARAAIAKAEGGAA